MDVETVVSLITGPSPRESTRDDVGVVSDTADVSDDDVVVGADVCGVVGVLLRGGGGGGAEKIYDSGLM